MSEILEEWRAIPGWPDYRVSNFGRVKRLKKNGADGRLLRERILKIVISTRHKKYLYCSVSLGDASFNKHFSVARLVLLAFVGPPEKGQECRHLNDISTDCRLENLAWGTRQENRDDAVRNKRMSVGESNGGAKLRNEEVIKIRNEYKPYNRKSGLHALARKYGVRPGTIGDIVHNRMWKHL